MDLQKAEGIAMTEYHLKAALRQHEVMLLYSCVFELPEKAPKTTLSIGIPFRYDLADDNVINSSPIHQPPFAKVVSDIQVGCNGLLAKHSLKQGPHSQGDAPSLQSISGYNYWLVADVKLVPGKNIVTFDFTIPYQQTLTGKAGRQPQTSFSPPTLDINLASAGAWGTPPNQADIEIFTEEMLADSISLSAAGAPLAIQKNDKGVITVNPLNNDGNGATLKDISIKFGAESQFFLNAEDLPDRIERLSSILVNGKRVSMLNKYTIVSSSTLPQTVNGEPGSAENLKKGDGFWAENVPGDGHGENLSITLDTPRKLVGFVIQSGASPMIAGKIDPEALRYPNVAYSLNSRPRRLDISINGGEYTFNATLRDDWNPQLILVPGFRGPVKNIKVSLNSVYKGAATDDTYITTLLPLVQ